MSNFLLNYAIVCCIFYLLYYWFDWENLIFNSIKDAREYMIREMERRDPFNPMLKDLQRKDLNDLKSNLDDKPLLKIARDFFFFPVNLILITIIMFDKLARK